MGDCSYCKAIIQKRYKLCNKCLFRVINEWINNLKPSVAVELNGNNLFPEILLKDMPKILIKDIHELLRCIELELWTASVLMSARLLESQLKMHLEKDLKVDSPNTIGQCIERLRRKDYSDEFLEHLNNLRELRNDAMHGGRRFSSDNALNTCKNVLGIIAWIYNIKK